MRKLRNALLVATGIVFGACATQTFRSEEAPDYVVTRDPTPFYLSKPRNEGTPDAALGPETRVKLLRQQSGYSLVLLEDSRKGYVANAYLTKASPGTQPRPFASPGPSPRPKRRASPTPTPQPSQPLETPVPQTSAPPTSPATPADSQAAPEEVPSPTPAPEAPIEKPKFRL
jgi:hypothetical protein